MSYLLTGLLLAAAQASPQAQLPNTQAVLTDPATEWRRPRDENLIYMQLEDGGRVLIELAPWMAPEAAANVRELVGAGNFDGGAINRVQENYVVQWRGRLDGPRGDARDSLPPEFAARRDAAADARFAPLAAADAYAPQVGFSGGFPAARDGEHVWLTHCYGMVGVGRGEEMDSADGSELYVVSGQAPRHLDRNITLIGRVLEGMEHLTTLPRGTEALGFYASAAEEVPIESIRLGSEVPEAERANLEVMRTDTQAFRRWADARANRARDGWFVYSHSAIDLCNLPVPVRAAGGEE